MKRIAVAFNSLCPDATKRNEGDLIPDEADSRVTAVAALVPGERAGRDPRRLVAGARHGGMMSIRLAKPILATDTSTHLHAKGKK